MSTDAPTTFFDLGLIEPLAEAVAALGYEAPTPIQALAIPPLLEGRDLIGQAQTGTGKTAAFALPLLQKLDPNERVVQGLVLCPTRELALQVAEAIFKYRSGLKGVRVLPIYGGQPIPLQLKRLRKGVHVVVGTPGRLLDHLERGSLDLSQVRMAVLDEGDEMLRMGFLDDVEAILEATNNETQIALFSATMPSDIKRVAEAALENPAHVVVEDAPLTVPAITQQVMRVPQSRKMEGLARVLETREADATLIFARTKLGCAEVADKLQAQGFSADALHGDLSQWQRTRVVEALKDGQIDIVVATDVAARGLDVPRISHVINLDMPYDLEAYVHRIGRTGRAGREGVATLFVTPREVRLLKRLERHIGVVIERVPVPSTAEVSKARVSELKTQLVDALSAPGLEPYRAVVEELCREGEFDAVDIAAAAARMARGDQPLVLPSAPQAPPDPQGARARIVLQVGHADGVRPGNIVGAIANEGGLPGKYIGDIDIRDTHSFVEVPGGAVDQLMARMRHTIIRRRPVQLRLAPRKRR